MLTQSDDGDRPIAGIRPVKCLDCGYTVYARPVSEVWDKRTGEMIRAAYCYCGTRFIFPGTPRGIRWFGSPRGVRTMK